MSFDLNRYLHDAFETSEQGVVQYVLAYVGGTTHEEQAHYNKNALNFLT